MVRSNPKMLAGPQQDHGVIRIAKSHGRPHNGVQYWLHVGRRPAYDTQDFARCDLLFQRFTQVIGALAQFVEQPRVLDGDHGLGGKTRQQVDLSFAERTNFLTIDRDHADQLIVLEHRHRDEAAHAGQFYEAPLLRIFVGGCFCRHVGDLDSALRLRHTRQHRCAGDRRQRLAASERDECGRCVVHRHRAAKIAFGEIQRAKIGLAKTRRAFQDDRKDPLQIARRRADQAQHLGCRGLLLQGLVQFLPIALEPLLQAGSGSAWLRFGLGDGTALAAGRPWAPQIRCLATSLAAPLHQTYHDLNPRRSYATGRRAATSILTLQHRSYGDLSRVLPPSQ